MYLLTVPFMYLQCMDMYSLIQESGLSIVIIVSKYFWHTTATFQSFHLLTVYWHDRNKFLFNWVEDLMNVRAPLSASFWSNSWCYLSPRPPPPPPFNQKGHKQVMISWRSLAVIISPSLTPVCGISVALEQGHDRFHWLLPKSEGIEHMLLQINHCDQSHGCTANQWSVSLWKSSPVPDAPGNDYVVSDAKGKLNIKEFSATACQFSTLT